MNGGFGGFQAGYNWQFAPNWLVGIEADFDWSSLKGSGISNFRIAIFGPANLVVSQKVDWFGTVRGRLGYVWANNLLVFATGGFAYGLVKDQAAINAPPFTGLGLIPFSFQCSATGANCFVGSSSQVRTGWTVGGGAEYAFWRNLSLKAEYLYINLGHDSVNIVAPTTIALPGQIPASFTGSTNHTDFHTVRAGLNWKF
jgi:outer membrane immunogenic protein